MARFAFSRPVLAWALYDWANSAFATTVMAGFFPVFFKQYWSAGSEVTVSTFRLGLANALASLCLALAAPLLGAIADCSQGRKRFLAAFASLGVVTTAALVLVAQGAWPLAVLLYVLATIGFSGGNVFYDALLLGVAPPAQRDVVSALGFALGYLGGGLLLALNVAMTLSPQTFGLADASSAVRLSFASVALWWAVFALPLLRWVPEPPAVAALPLRRALRAGLRQLGATLRDLRHERPLLLFLLAYWLYIDGVDTVVRMAVDYGLSLGFASSHLIAALLITQFVGFPAALAFGVLGRTLGARTGILLGLAVYVGVCAWAYRMQRPAEFYLLAAAVGCVQGGVQALSRSLYSRLIPPARAAEFFGFYNMMGKYAAIVGPLLMGAFSLATGSPRAAIFPVAGLFVAGGVLLLGVREKGL